MYLKRLSLRNFRNYAQAEVSFSPQINLIRGENGQGKTNLLEAIHLVSTGRSFRTNALSDLIYFGQNFFYVEAEFYKEGVTQTIKIYYDKATRKIQYNETLYPTLTSLLGILPSVLLSPDDLSLVSGTPAERRRFLNIHIAQTDPLYVHHLGRYFKAMEQRNHLLRSKSQIAIEAWEQMMAISASYLITKRALATLALQLPSSAWMQTLSCSRDNIGIQYHSSLSSPHSEEHFQQIWQKSRPKEMLLGATQAGPHRDDLVIHLADKPVKTFSSEGQKRSCITALRFAQWQQMAEVLGHPPLLGIDDVGIQLDPQRQMQLHTHLAKFNQVFLTSPYAMQDVFPKETFVHTLTIEKGAISTLLPLES